MVPTIYSLAGRCSQDTLSPGPALQSVRPAKHGLRPVIQILPAGRAASSRPVSLPFTGPRWRFYLNERQFRWNNREVMGLYGMLASVTVVRVSRPAPINSRSKRTLFSSNWQASNTTKSRPESCPGRTGIDDFRSDPARRYNLRGHYCDHVRVTPNDNRAN